MEKYLVRFEENRKIRKRGEGWKIQKVQKKKISFWKLRKRKLGKQREVEERERFAEAHEPRRSDAARVRADENTRAWRWRTRVPGPKRSERAFCCARQLATARRALALAATVASPWSTPVSLLFLHRLVSLLSALYPSLFLSYSSLSCLPLKKKKEKSKRGREKKKKEKQATLEFKGRRFKLAGKLLVTAIFLERGVAFNWKLVLQSLQLTRSSFHSTSLLSRRIVETGSRFVRDSWHFVAASVTSCESSVQLFDCPFTFILSVLIFHLRFEFDQVYCLFSSYYYLTIDFIIAFIYIRTRMRIILITHPTVLLNIKLKI